MGTAMDDLYAAEDRIDFEVEESHASVLTIDFSYVTKIRQHKSGILRDRGTDPRPLGPDGKLLTPKQIRARARRRYKRAMNNSKPLMSTVEFEHLYKPLEDWTMDELARGRPVGKDGSFKGPAPKWITREIHEQAMERFTRVVKTEMSAHTVDALQTLQYILTNEDTDNRGKPYISAAVKLDATKFLIEHVVGKPKQHITQDISIKLQGLLGSVMVNPNEALAPPELGGVGLNGAAYSVGHFPGHTIPIGTADDIVDGEVIEEQDIDWLEDND